MCQTKTHLNNSAEINIVADFILLDGRPCLPLQRSSSIQEPRPSVSRRGVCIQRARPGLPLYEKEWCTMLLRGLASGPQQKIAMLTHNTRIVTALMLPSTLNKLDQPLSVTVLPVYSANPPLPDPSSVRWCSINTRMHFLLCSTRISSCNWSRRQHAKRH